MSTRSSSLAKSQHRPAHSGLEARARRGAEQPAARNDVDRGVVSAPAVAVPRSGPLIPASLRLDMIRDAAFFRAEARGFAPGQEIEDWLAAEQDVDDLIRRRYGR
jgi:hypothetical protein